ncbi:uncharacterized protein [Dermacentor albipictus]|uniref:uncharacterized protein n=1 Tax=Dermacentor albipictus TaxID=60249 RepID=UPI0038FCFC13
MSTAQDGDTDVRSRAQRSEQETRTLIRIWQDHLGDLRRTKRNSKVYAAIQEGLRAEGVDKPLKAIKSKIENLGNKYRDLCKKRCTGQGAIAWKYFWELHGFLGTLPVNDKSLTDEIGCSGATVEELVHDMVHGTHCDSEDVLDDIASHPPSPEASQRSEDAVVPIAEMDGPVPETDVPPANSTAFPANAPGIGRKTPVLMIYQCQQYDAVPA